MFDETKLYVAAPGGHRAKKRRTLAQACQITYKKPFRQVQDMDIVRPPALVQRCTAAACAGVVGKPDDPFGILPARESMPKASLYAFLTATDSHSVNKLVSKFISAHVDKQNIHIYFLGGLLPPLASLVSARTSRPKVHRPLPPLALLASLRLCCTI